MTRPGAEDGRQRREATQEPAWEEDAEVLWAAFDALGAGAMLLDRSGHIRCVNAEGARLLVRSPTDMHGADAHDMLHRGPHGQVVARSESELLAVMERGVAADGGHVRFLQGDGHLLPVEWSSAPIRRGDEVVGAAVLFVEATERLDAQYRAERELAELRDRADRLALLAEVTTVLTQSLEVDETLRRLGRLITRRLADWAIVVLRTGDGPEHRLAVLPTGDDTELRWSSPLPPFNESANAPLSGVLRRGRLASLGPDDLASPVSCPMTAVHRRLLVERGASSVVIAPLRTARHVLGAVTAVRNDPSRPFNGTEEALISDIAYRAGLAIDNARLFRQQRDIAVTLQHHLLTPLPQTGTLQLAARYLPAAAGAEVGGDWYDALVLSDGVICLIIGDVLGHDLDAVAGMAQLRNMLRSLAWDRREPPSVVVDRLDRAIPVISTVSMATVIVARVSETPEGGWRLHWTSAGHPPPLLVTPEGEARFLEQHQDTVLGTGLAASFQRHDVIEQLPPGSTLLLYTDGLIEEPGVSLDSGLSSLRRHATGLGEHTLNDFCDQIVHRMEPSGRDDIALVALRVPRAGAPR